MKVTILCFFGVLIAAFGWTYAKHHEALEDFNADITNDPMGIHAVLEETKGELTLARRKIEELTTKNESLAKDIKTSEAKIKELSDKIADLSKPPAPAPTLSTATASAPPPPPPAHWSWTTTDGRTFNDVVVTKVEGDTVTILDSDGGAKVSIATLPPDVQARLKATP